MKPAFLCIGAQKSGTTSLIHYMNQHPEIYMAPGEIHFFDTYYDKNNIEEYENNFKTPKKYAGEKTPSLHYLRYAMDRVHRHYPGVKLILMLREPVSRAFSQYNMDCQKVQRKVCTQEFVEHMKSQVTLKLADIRTNGPYSLARGFYSDHLEYILSKFPEENLYVAISEEIRENKLAEYNRIYEFIGTHRLNNIQNHDQRIGEYQTRLDRDAAKIIYQLYKPYNEKLYHLVGRRIDAWERFYSSYVF